MCSKQYICTCFFKRNIFIKSLNLHVVYENDEQFMKTYGNVFKARGYNSLEIENVKSEIAEEIQRRLSNGFVGEKRQNEIMSRYKPLHHDVYHLKESMLSTEFIKICESATKGFNKDALLKMAKKHSAKEVYSFPIFENEFCEKLLEELKHFEASDLPKGRPNSMNKTGVLLEELGFYPNFLNRLRNTFLSPLVSILYPDLSGHSGVDSQRAFIVSYNHVTQGDQSDLNTHFDNAEVTINISLNENYSGGELYFTHAKNEIPSETIHRVDHKQGWGVLHRGAHFHGAMPLESGERYNMIIWMRASSIRNKQCPMCDDVPTLKQVPIDGDGFTTDIVELCNLT